MASQEQRLKRRMFKEARSRNRIHTFNRNDDAFWESEPGYVRGEKAYKDALEELYGGEGGDAVRSFVEVDGEIGGIDDAFAEATEEEEEGSPAYAAAEKKRDSALAALSFPPDLVEKVTHFRNGIRAPYEEALTDIDNAEEAEQLSYSISGRIGIFLEPVVKPLGFDWRIAMAIIGSFAAKEVFVAQMGIVYSVGEADEESEGLRGILQQHYNPLQAFCMMLWALLSLPCVVTIAVAKREAGGWKYAIAMMVGFTLVAYATTLIVYQVGNVLGIGV